MKRKNYPKSYDDILSKEAQEKLIKYISSKSRLLGKLQKDQTTLYGIPELYRSYEDQIRDLQKSISSIRNVFEEMGIFIEYNWPGHRGEWFLATLEDYLDYEDWLFQCAE